MARRPAALVLGLAVLVAAPPAAALLGLGLEPRVGPHFVFPEDRSYPAFAPNGTFLGNRSWRVTSFTGNPNENYLAATPTGRVLDFGGEGLRFTDDRGLTWSSVNSREPALSAEGAVAVAPNGDVVGITWDPATGDRVLAFKHDAAAAKWLYVPATLHTPFYDRPWLGVIPGPFTVGAVTVPYVSVLKGGAVSKEVWFYSLDGLHYLAPSSRWLDTQLRPRVEQWLVEPALPSADWVQAIGPAGITALPGGGALSPNVDVPRTPPVNCGWRILLEDLRWSCFGLPAGPAALPQGVLRVDSLGRLHHAARSALGFTYQVSADGGQTWAVHELRLPAGLRTEDWDFKVHGAADVAAIAVHAHRLDTETDQDLVFKLAGLGAPAPGVEVMLVGDGDQDFGSFLGDAEPRFDFMTVAILPDGKVATSLGDAAHPQPSVAIEL